MGSMQAYFALSCYSTKAGMNIKWMHKNHVEEFAFPLKEISYPAFRMQKETECKP